MHAQILEPQTKPDPKTIAQGVADQLGNFTHITASTGETYINANEMIQIIASGLGNEIQTDEDYQALLKLTNQVAALSGYGREETLAPPLVRFDQIGSYRKRLDPLSAEQIETSLAIYESQDGIFHYTLPYRLVHLDSIAQILAKQLFGTNLRDLHDCERLYILSNVSEQFLVRGWQLGDKSCPYTEHEAGFFQPLTPNRAGFDAKLDQLILRRGHPLFLDATECFEAGCGGAFFDETKIFISEDDGLIPSHWLSEAMVRNGYTDKPNQDNQFEIKPFDLPANEDEIIFEATLAHPETPTIKGNAILYADLMKGIAAAFGPEMTDKMDAAFKYLALKIDGGPIGRALITRGYKPETCEINGRILVTETERRGYVTVFPQQISVGRGVKTISIASGKGCLVPSFIHDDGEPVYFELLGYRQEVKAQYAKIVGGSTFWFENSLIRYRKEFQIRTIRKPLTGGRMHLIGIMQQADHTRMLPGKPIYILGTRPDEPDTLERDFFNGLSKIITIPLLPSWGSMLWIEGQAAGLVRPIDDDCHGRGAYKITPKEEHWANLIADGFSSGALTI